MDIILALCLLVLTSPLLLITAILIKLEDGGGIIFRQTRTGLNGTPFTIYKFRTMRENHGVLAVSKQKLATFEDGVPDHFVYKCTDQQSNVISKLGRILRKYSIDELPQIMNILIGNMSFVGPRPELTDITQYYSEYQSRRLEVKPGLTGLAQINGRSNITNGEKIDYDITYVKKCSMKMDISICWKTCIYVISGKDAV